VTMQDLVNQMQLGENGIVAFRRLNRRYSAFGGPTTFPTMRNDVQPVTILDEVLIENQPINESLDLRGAGSLHVVAFTVPSGRLFQLTHWFRGSSGGNTRVEVVLQGERIILESSGLSSEQIINLTPIFMEPGDTLGMLESGNAGDSTISLQAIGRIQDAF